MKFIQRTSLQDQVDQKHTNELRTMETTESPNLDLLELKDFSLQEYLNQSYDLSDSHSKPEGTNIVPTTSLSSENLKVVTEVNPTNNNSVTLEPKVTLTFQPQTLQPTKQYELVSVVDIDVKPTIDATSSAVTSRLDTTGLFEIKDEKLDDISIFFEELEGQYPTLRTVDTDGVEIKQEKCEAGVATSASASLQPVASVSIPGPPKYSDVANTVNIQVSSLTPIQPPPSYQEAVTLSSSDAQTFHLIPSQPSVASVSSAASAQSVTLPVTSVGNSGASQIFVEGNHQPAATVSLNFHNELNEFCEGILNQIESSDWNGISLDSAPSLGGSVSFSASLSDPVTRPLGPGLLTDPLESGQPPAAQMMVKMEPETSDVDINDPRWVTGRASLPSGWKMRVVDTSIGTRSIKKSHFLAPTGHFFDSRKSAIDHMIRTHSYSDEDIETMKKGLREKTKFDWSSSREDVPRGWKTREKLSSDGKTRIFYLSPGGISFPCRLAAYEHMVKDGGYSIEDIELMKIGSKNKRNKAKDFREGDPSLPNKWKIRINAQQKESFRSPQGVFFHSRQAVLDELIKTGAPHGDIEKVRSKIPTGKKQRRKKSSGEFKWTEGDPSCPAGWKIRVVQCADGHSVTFFLTPEGTTIKGRKAALQHMLKTGLYSQHDVDLMKNHLNVISKVSDIWTLGDPTLPVGWKIKKYKSKSDSSRVHCEYLSPQNQVFRSRKSVVEHMRKVGGYTEQDVKIVEAGNVKFKQKNVHEFGVTGATASWVESESLPKGWRIKEEGDGEQKKTVYLSPEGKVFWTRNQVLEAVINSGASQEDINKVQGGLDTSASAEPQPQQFSAFVQKPEIVSSCQTDSSISHPILTKAFAQATKRPTVLSTSSPITANNQVPTTSIRINTQSLPQQSLKILEEKSVPSSLKITASSSSMTAGKPTILESKQKPARGNEIVWKVCLQSLPAGWKMRTLYWTNREKHFYLSPEGKIFSSRKAIVEFMEHCGTYSEQDFEKVKKGINRKRRKDNDQWVPLRKKQKKKSSKANIQEKDESLVMTNNTDDTPESSSNNDFEVDGDDTSDQQPASIKPCTVRIENFSKNSKL